MRGDPQIALVISCYNQERWVDLTLPSAMAQRVDVPFEIIICDDGSSDRGFDRVRRLAAGSDADIRYVWQPDRGFRLSRSRNNGIRCARGRVLVFVDGDSWLAPTFLQDHWQAHQDLPALVCGMRVTVNVPAARLDRFDPAILGSLSSRVQAEQLRQQRWAASDAPWMACLGGNFSVPRSTDVYFDEGFESWGSEDRDLAFRLSQIGLRPRLLANPNAVHIRVAGECGAVTRHDEVVAFLRNKLRLQAKYPNGELGASLTSVTHCHLDPDTQQWSIGPRRRNRSVDDVFAEFRAWAAGSPSDASSLARGESVDRDAEPAAEMTREN
jgi:glycosyltransferase involved in cell wall biosynthesis